LRHAEIVCGAPFAAKGAPDRHLRRHPRKSESGIDFVLGWGFPLVEDRCIVSSWPMAAAAIEAINLTRHDFHGEWNYTVSPNACAPTQ
jgi:hypothetical protein